MQNCTGNPQLNCRKLRQTPNLQTQKYTDLLFWKWGYEQKVWGREFYKENPIDKNGEGKNL